MLRLIKISTLPLVALFAISNVTFAQDYSEDVSEFRPTFTPEEVVIEISDTSSTNTDLEDPSKHSNTKVEEVIETMAETNSQYEYMAGYRVQIYVGSSEGTASGMRAKARQYYSQEELPIELRYELPNFKVKAGDFLDKLTAYRWLVKLKEYFPRALLVPEKKVKLENVR